MRGRKECETEFTLGFAIRTPTAFHIGGDASEQHCSVCPESRYVFSGWRLETPPSEQFRSAIFDCLSDDVLRFSELRSAV